MVPLWALLLLLLLSLGGCGEFHTFWLSVCCGVPIITVLALLLLLLSVGFISCEFGLVGFKGFILALTGKDGIWTTEAVF